MPLCASLPTPASQCPFTQGHHSALCRISDSWREKWPGCLRLCVSLTGWLWSRGAKCLPGLGSFCRQGVQPEEVMSSGVQPHPSAAWHILLLPMDPVLEAPSPHPSYKCSPARGLWLTAPGGSPQHLDVTSEFSCPFSASPANTCAQGQGPCLAHCSTTGSYNCAWCSVNSCRVTEINSPPPQQEMLESCLGVALGPL